MIDSLYHLIIFAKRLEHANDVNGIPIVGTSTGVNTGVNNGIANETEEIDAFNTQVSSDSINFMLHLLYL